MASHISKNGKVWRDPVRSTTRPAGERIQLWANAALQERLLAYAAAHSCSVRDAARAVLMAWAASGAL